MIPLTVVAGGSAASRERAIAAHLPPGRRSAAILEGIPDGKNILQASDGLHVARIAAGCLCCSGQLVLRVTLNRVLRMRPEQLFIALADAAHLAQLRSWLSDTPYDQLLELGPDIMA